MRSDLVDRSFPDGAVRGGVNGGSGGRWIRIRAASEIRSILLGILVVLFFHCRPGRSMLSLLYD